MNRSELGKRIKEARLAKKLTQTEVVGTFITRNMLSQIESGTATPSLKTLEYLAGVLDIPIQTLIPDGREGSAYLSSDPDADAGASAAAAKLWEAKEHYAEGRYDLAARLAESLINGSFSDEGCAIAARCYMSMAEDCEKAGDMSKAAELARKADELADKGIYASREIKTGCTLLLNRVAEKLTKAEF